jgi:hypothetical protein
VKPLTKNLSGIARTSLIVLSVLYGSLLFILEWSAGRWVKSPTISSVTKREISKGGRFPKIDRRP